MTFVFVRVAPTISFCSVLGNTNASDSNVAEEFRIAETAEHSDVEGGAVGSRSDVGGVLQSGSVCSAFVAAVFNRIVCWLRLVGYDSVASDEVDEDEKPSTDEVKKYGCSCEFFSFATIHSIHHFTHQQALSHVNGGRGTEGSAQRLLVEEKEERGCIITARAMETTLVRAESIISLLL